MTQGLMFLAEVEMKDRRITVMGLRMTPEQHLDLAKRIAKAVADELDKPTLFERIKALRKGRKNHYEERRLSC